MPAPQIEENRPQGSLLKRPCTCRASGQQLCLPHRLEASLRGKGQSRKVWASSSTEFLAAVRRLLTALDIENPEQYTLKMFRAGHATTLAEEGKSIGHILQAGEWKAPLFSATSMRTQSMQHRLWSTFSLRVMQSKKKMKVMSLLH